MSAFTKKLKEIKKYGRLRFANELRYNERTFVKIYMKASPEKQKLFDDEMQTYFKAIENGEIQPGDSILKSFFGDSKIEVTENTKP